jgi:transposase
VNANRRIASRRGPVKAIVAIEHTMLVAIWHMTQTGAAYDDLGGDFYARLHPEKVTRRAIEQLHAMGYQVTLNPLQEPA